MTEHLTAAASEAYDKKVEEVGADLMPLVERDVMLRTIDWQWMEYLTQMEHFREGIGLRAYGQRDPLVEYKNEAFEMFNELRERIQGSIVAGHLQGVGPAQRAATAAAADGAAGAGERPGRPGRRGRPQRSAAQSAGGAPDRRGCRGRGTGRKREDWTQRSVLVRLGQEIQALSRQVGAEQWTQN